jgi:hypothetical protein
MMPRCKTSTALVKALLRRCSAWMDVARTATCFETGRESVSVAVGSGLWEIRVECNVIPHAHYPDGHLVSIVVDV